MKKYILFIFSIVLSISIKAQITFDAQDTLSTLMYNVNTVIASDIDGDGILDVVSASDGVVAWYKNDGDAHFQLTDTISIGDFAAIAVGDLNNDGSNDLLYAERNYNELGWCSNDGHGNFTKEDTIRSYGSSIAMGTMSIKIIDMNNDQINDIVVSHYNKDSLRWYENINGDGSEWIRHPIAETYAFDIYPADIDGDGDIDIAAAFPSPDKQVGWFKNNNDGTWTKISLNNPTTDNPLTIFVSDLNNDNRLDIIGGSSGSNTDSAQVFWYENLGNSNFGTKTKIYAISKGSSPDYKFNDVLSADLDLDGDQDIVSASDDNQLKYFINNGNASFSSAKDFNASLNNPVSIFAADMDGTTDMDILTASMGDNTIAIQNNASPIIITGPQNPARVCEGTDSVMFTVKAINAVSYSWREEGHYISDGSQYKGTNTDTLYVNADWYYMNGYKYDCVIYNETRDTSNYAVLTIDKKIIAQIGLNDNDRNLSLCDQNTSTLKGNDPSPNTGNWSCNDADISFDNSSVYNTIVHFGHGEYELYWTIDNKSCGLSTDTMTIKNYQNFTADAGSDTELCDTTKFQLHANTPPTPSTGTWKWSSSWLAFNDTSAADAIVSNLHIGNNTLNWTVDNGNCGSDAQEIIITVYQSIIADAGDDISICDQTVASLSGNDPSPGSGYWTTSNSEVIFNSTTDHNVYISNIPHGQTTFTWTITNGACGSNSDQMVLSSYNAANFVEQPVDLTVTAGENAYFAIKTSGDISAYQWYKDDNPINDDTRINGSATDSIVINTTQTTDAGTYKCVITDMCYNNEHNSNTAQLTVNASATGFNNPDNEEFKIYPNPNNGIFTIDHANAKINRITILNARGAVIYEQENTADKQINIDISSYPKGVYILRIDQKNFVKDYKIILN
jgi:hypothetical protein